ncbi:outer membrane protein transport protein [Hymenobacter sp. BT770]|uniref:OmpP1/FadL family transporter n=1 Tax=Hymenobacter sp. BT770 TaxID=2886942 RepID=UPI001D12A7B6|nr:outer membrane protein transport protein [Hymenobacter sp. BT770]MCC3153386.1 outer membrane protein transport protein [Hymenobacter sp. BT770]MDO3415532.1 outer membrane protein transport protein [Hymenobacter sp. BT770]
MTVKTLLLAGGTLLVSASAASASGFQVNLGGQKNIGMGGVGVGLSLDQAAMFYNPGALAMVRENGVQVGVNAALGRVSYRSENGGELRSLDNSVVTPFNVYASFGPAEGKFKFGVGVYTPYGSKLKYAEGWEGRYALTEIDLEAVYVQPTFSYAITPQLSVGAGLMILAHGSVNLQKDLPLPTGPGHVTLDGKTKTHFGYNAGIFFKPSDKLSAGVSYRSQIDATVESGSVTFSGLPTGASAAIINRGFTADKFSATLPLPAVASAGIGINPTEKLTIGVDASLTFWSAYRTLDFQFSGNNGNAGAATDANTGLVGGNTTSTSKRYYQDALAFRLGGQYQVSDKLAVRAGAAYDFSAVRAGYVGPETPDADRAIGTAGLSYQVTDHLGVDASFMFEAFRKQTQTQQDLLNNGTTDRVAGTYRTNVYIPGIGLHYKF